MLNVTITDVAIITTKNVDYRSIIYNISKSEAINLLKNSVLEDHRYIFKFSCFPFYKLFFFFFFFFFCVFCFSKYNMDIYKSVKINIGTVMKNPETLKMCKDAFKNYLI